MKIFETSLKFCHQQVLYLILMYEDDKYYTAFCVDTKEITLKKYNAGDLIYLIPKEEVSISEYNIEDSPLQGNYLLAYYIKKFGIK